MKRNQKLIVQGITALAIVAVVSMGSNLFLYPPIQHAKESWRVSSQVINRNIASVKSLNNTGARIYIPTPATPTPYPTPIISPDNPIQPRASSVQSGDAGILNLFNFFNFNLINQPTIPEALCNDGSKPGYYLKKGFGAGAKRWMIWLEGGGGCGSADPNDPLWCGNRIGYSSSSNNMPTPIIDFQGILSKSDTYNPDFYSYNQVVVHYCSSDFWGGLGVQKEINPTTHQRFWFSGRKIVEALILDLKQRYGFSNATNVILTGSSAGGSGIVINANEIKAAIPTADVITLVDASHFFTFYDFESGLLPEDELNYSRAPAGIIQAYSFLPMEGNRECLAHRFTQRTCGKNERCQIPAYECMLPGHAAPYLKTPVFVSADQLDNLVMDSYGLSLCDNTNPDDYSRWLNAWNAEASARAQLVSGYFLPRTGDHGLAPSHHWSTPVDNNGTPISLKNVFGAWYFNRSTTQKRFIQAAPAGMFPHQEVGNLCPGGNYQLMFH